MFGIIRVRVQGSFNTKFTSCMIYCWAPLWGPPLPNSCQLANSLSNNVHCWSDLYSLYHESLQHTHTSASRCAHRHKREYSPQSRLDCIVHACLYSSNTQKHAGSQTCLDAFHSLKIAHCL
jgi:hypothetical protein